MPLPVALIPVDVPEQIVMFEDMVTVGEMHTEIGKLADAAPFPQLFVPNTVKLPEVALPEKFIVTTLVPAPLAKDMPVPE